MLGGGEYSLLDLLLHVPPEWLPLAVVPENGELASRLAKGGIDTLVRPLPRIRPWLLAQVLSALKDYTVLFRRYIPSLVYANGSRAAFYGGIACRFSRVPLVWHCRIVDRDPTLDWLLCTLSTKIVVNSRATAQRFSRFFRNKTQLVYNAVDLNWLQSGPAEKPDLIGDNWKVILAVARASREKRHDILLSAFESVAANDTNVHLVCLGGKDHLDLEWWQHLQKRSHASPFSKRIHWLGHVDDVRPWYRAAHFLALGSQTESFGRVLVEAMASGLPIIATRAGGIPEIVRDHQDGLLVTPGNIAKMAEGFSRLLKDSSLRQRLRESGLERALIFDIKAHVNQMITIFEDCIKK
jgi:glycosyltransferase involved in cell wall biosynthesis